MKKFTITCIIITIIVTALYNYNTHLNRNTKTNIIYSQLSNEENNPERYLNQEITYRKRIFHRGYQIYIKIKNNSKYTTYQNLKYKIDYYSKTGIKIDTEIINVYETLRPNKKINTSEYTNKKIRKVERLSINLIDIDTYQY